ncbi:MAG: shikimate 5-dehydrogenase [Clostridia bacterium]|nr:shikimate 5-dehydrogenase [Clostridia bacterium]
MKKYGCIGKKLTHSFSREIHAHLADYEYELIELNEDEIAPFFEKKEFNAINVTIPYKQTVLPHLDEVSEVAKRIGAVNTIVNRNGKLYGYNTDYYGMKALIERAKIDLKGKSVLILGTGGTSKTAVCVSLDLGAKSIKVVSRNASENYIDYAQAVSKYSNSEIIINTTPVGMYPNCDAMPIDVDKFPRLEGVIDAIYNPLNTNLVLRAKEKKIKATGGLFMLVKQAVVAVEKFLDKTIDDEITESVYASILAGKENIVLTGMPSCGKTTVGKLLNIEGYEFIDTDEEIVKRCNCSIKELIESKGEKYFRDIESKVIAEISVQNKKIIATGGGAILREENVTNLKRNGKIFFIDANFSRLIPTGDRPLSCNQEKLKKLYDERIDIYKSTADIVVPDDTAQNMANYILNARK